MQRNITETPEKWIILSVQGVGYKVFASWTDDSWKINSGIVKIKEDDNFYYFFGYSGSCYKCHKTSYGIATSYSARFLDKAIALAKGKIKEMENRNNWLDLV